MRTISLLLLFLEGGVGEDYFLFSDLQFKVPLLFLTIVLIFPTVIAFFQKSFSKGVRTSFLVFLVFFLVFLVFLVNSFWFFFIVFELSVIPLLLIVSSLGGSKNRMEARAFLFLFTRGSSLIFLIFLAWRRGVSDMEFRE